MAFGMTLGVRAGMGGAGTPPRRDNYKRFGSSLRAGGGRSYSNFAGTPGQPETARQARTPDYSELAEDAARQAQSASMAGSVPPPQQARDPMADVAVLGGGSMGLKPDFTEVERLEKEAARELDAFPKWALGFAGVGSILEGKMAARRQQIEMAKEKAIRDAMSAREEAAYKRAGETWTDTKATTAEGVVIEQNALTGETRPAYTATKKEEYDWGPEFDGATTTMTTETPRMDATIVEKNRQAAIDAAEAKEKEAARNREITALGAKEKEVARYQSGLRRGEIAATGEETRKTNKELAGLGRWDGREPSPTVTGDAIATQIARGMGFFGEQDYEKNATPEDRERFRKEYARASRAPERGGRGGWDDSDYGSSEELPPKAIESVKGIPPGKTLTFENGQVWLNDNGTPRRVR